MLVPGIKIGSLGLTSLSTETSDQSYSNYFLNNAQTQRPIPELSCTASWWLDNFIINNKVFLHSLPHTSNAMCMSEFTEVQCAEYSI